MPDQNLGYGRQTETTIDQANIAMRSMPWYQDLLRSMGKDPNGPIRVSKEEGQRILRGAQQNGFVIDEGSLHIDDSGNIDKKGHAVRNTLIVAGIAAATIATMGAAGAFSGAAGAGGAAGGAGAGAGASGLSAGTAGVAASLPGAMATLPALAGGAGGAGAAGLGAAGWLGTAGKVAEALGGLSSGRAAGRQAENQAAYYGDQNIIDLYKAQQAAAANRNNIDLSQKKFSLEAPQLRASNSVRGDVLANAQDATVSGVSPNIPVPTISGGLRPSMFSANTRALGGLMSEQALASQKAGDTFSPLPDATAPSLTAVSQPGKLDSFLNVASGIGSLASLMGSIPYRRKKPMPGAYGYNYEGGG